MVHGESWSFIQTMASKQRHWGEAVKMLETARTEAGNTQTWKFPTSRIPPSFTILPYHLSCPLYPKRWMFFNWTMFIQIQEMCLVREICIWSQATSFWILLIQSPAKFPSALMLPKYVHTTPASPISIPSQTELAKLFNSSVSCTLSPNRKGKWIDFLAQKEQPIA